MEEKIPQLTLTPDLGKEPVLEPVKEEDLIEKGRKRRPRQDRIFRC